MKFSVILSFFFIFLRDKFMTLVDNDYKISCLLPFEKKNLKRDFFFFFCINETAYYL